MTVTHAATAKKLAVGVALVGLATALALVRADAARHHGSAGTTSDAAIAPVSTTLSAPPIDTAAVTSSFGWLLTPDQLLVSSDNGTTLTDTLAPVPTGPARAAHFHDTHSGIVAGSAGGTITIARTADGGATWKTTTVSDPSLGSEIGYSELRLAFGTPNRGALLARIATSGNFSVGTLFATADGGATWTAHQALAAGEVAVQPDGRVWLAGGALGDQLFTSADAGAHWTKSQLTVQVGRQVSGVGLPINGRLPVTVLNAGATEFEMLATTDQGASWHPAKSVGIVGHTAMNVREPVAETAGGTVVFDTAGGHAWRVDDGTDLHPTGLPQGLDRVAFASDGKTGWAIAVYGSCANGKQNCTLSREVVRTADGGASWQRIELWAEKLS